MLLKWADLPRGRTHSGHTSWASICPPRMGTAARRRLSGPYAWPPAFWFLRWSVLFNGGALSKAVGTARTPELWDIQGSQAGSTEGGWGGAAGTGKGSEGKDVTLHAKGRFGKGAGLQVTREAALKNGSPFKRGPWTS